MPQSGRTPSGTTRAPAELAHCATPSAGVRPDAAVRTDTGHVDIVNASVAGTFGLLIGAATDRVVLRRQVVTERREQRREAADRILPGLRRLRDLTRDAEARRKPKTWSRAVVDSFAAIDDVSNRLPQSWRHLRQSVRIATGEVAGAVTFSDLSPQTRDVPLPAYNHQWAMYASEYLEYVIFRVQQWRDEPRLGRTQVPDLLNYDNWLYDTDRTDGPAPLGWKPRRSRRRS